MHLFQQNKKKTRYPLVVVTLLAVVVILVDVLFGGSVRTTARSGIALVHVGATGALERVSTSGFFQTKRRLALENTQLKEELRALKVLRFENDVVRAENNVLRDLLNVADERPEGVTARIASSIIASPFSTIVVRAGERHGVRVGDFAIASGDVAVGEVLEVGDGTALVGLFTAPGSDTDVSIAGALVSAEGRGGGNAHVQLPRSISVAKGDLVFVAGSEFAFGIVGSVEVSAADAFQDVFIRVPTNLNELTFVKLVH